MEEDLTAMPVPTETPSLTPVPDYTEQFNLITVDVEGIRKDLELLKGDVDDLLENTEALTGYMEYVTTYTEYVAGFGLFGIVVTVCYFAYKFFRMFF